MSTAKNFYSSQKHLVRAKPLTVVLPPAKPRTVAPPPAAISSRDTTAETISAQLKVNALQKKAAVALVSLGLDVAFILFTCCMPELNNGWFAQVSDGDALKSISNPVTRSLLSSATGPMELHHREFSPQKFFSNFFGWVVIALCICGIRDSVKYVNAANAVKAVHSQNQEIIC